jgi:hypothetical protein
MNTSNLYKLAGAALPLVILSYFFFSDDSPTPEQAKSILSGSWVYNSLECNDGIERETLYEIQIGSGLNNGAMNAYRTDNNSFSYLESETPDAELAQTISNAFGGCAIHDEPEERPIIFRFTIDRNEATIIGYKQSSLIIKIENDDVTFLRPISRIKSLLEKTKG